VGWGRDVVKSDSGETEAPFAGEVITTGTEVEEAFVAVFWTCNWTVEGVATMLLARGLERVFESTRDVEIAFPFQRMTLSLVKFVPETLMVRFFEPAAIVWGTTRLILGVACTWTKPDPQPRQRWRSAKLTVAAIAWESFAKSHLDLLQDLSTLERLRVCEKITRSGRINWKLQWESGYYSYPIGDAGVPLSCD
jgi:hypothetical protein